MRARRPPLSRQEIRLLATLVIGSLLLLAVLVGVNLALSRKLPGGGGFYSPWAAARAYLLERTEPYGPGVPARVQDLVYGRPAHAAEDPYLPDIPFHLLLPLYLAPALIAQPEAARGIWMAASELALLGLALLSLRVADWTPRRFLLILFLVSATFSFYTIQALIEGGPQILLGVIYLAILIALRDQRDEVLGGLLTLACFKWELGGLFLLFVFVRLLYERRWGTLTVFGMILSVLLAVSFLAYPGWLVPFLQATWAGLRAYRGTTAGAVLAGYLPEAGSRVAFGLAVTLLIVLGIEWWAARGGDFRRMAWAACLTLAATPLLAFRSEIGNLIVLLPGFTFLLAVIHDRWRRAGPWLASILLLASLAVPWIVYLRAVPLDESVIGPLFLFAPVLTILGLYWTRWWAIRPARALMERAVQQAGR